MFTTRKWWLLLIAALLPLSAHATNVTATVTDTGGQIWARGLWQVSVVPPAGTSPDPSFNQNGTINSSGVFTVTLNASSTLAPSGSKWMLQVCALANFSCYTTFPTITGSSQSLTVTPPVISIPISTQPISAYNDSEILNPQRGQTYFNVLDNFKHIWNGISWVISSNSGLPANLNYFHDYFFRTGSNLGTNYTDWVNSMIPNSGAMHGTSVGNVNLTAMTGVTTASGSQNISGYILTANGGSSTTGVAGRINGTPYSAVNYYACEEDASGMYLDKFVGTSNGSVGSRVSLASSATVTGDGDYINLQIVGQALTCTLNRTQLVLQVNDSSYSTGPPGVFLYGSLSATDQSFTVASPSAPAGTTVNVVCDGDSTVWGSGVWTTACESLVFPEGSVPFTTNVGVERKGLGTSVTAANAGTLETMIATGTTVVDPLIVAGATNIVILQQDMNDYAINNTTNAQEITYLTTYVAARHAAGWKVVIVPAFSRTGQDSINQAFDQLLLSNPEGADALVTLPQSLIGPKGYDNTQFFIADGIHPNQFSNTTILAPAISAAINSIF